MQKLKIFYNDQQSTDADTGFSPSAKKPAKLMEYWQSREEPVELISNFLPATKEQFYRAHEKEHIDAVLAGQKANGFYNTSLAVAETLPWTTGSMLAATLHAWEHKTVTMSPTSGFHHASQNECKGFCTFNGLMVTALALLEKGASRIGILDLDHHYGNGADTIIEWLVGQGKNQTEQFHHYTVGRDLRVVKNIGSFDGHPVYAWQGGDATERWLSYLPEIVQSFEGCDIILFQAGADPHIDDPCHAMIGAVGALTNEQFLLRDQMVFEGIKDLGIPVAWNLAGGYQNPLQKVLDIHTGTLHQCMKVYGNGLA